MTPKVIKTEEEYQASLARLEVIFEAEPGTPDGDEAELLTALIMMYEEQYYPMDLPDPVDAIKFRMEQQGLTAEDLGLFINGLPIATFELKNSLTKQTVADAVEQYKLDRDPKEPLFRFGRCVVHFAVDDSEVMMCTELKGKASWFLPFNQGYNEFYKQFVQNDSFRRFVTDMVMKLTDA